MLSGDLWVTQHPYELNLTGSFPANLVANKQANNNTPISPSGVRYLLSACCILSTT